MLNDGYPDDLEKMDGFDEGRTGSAEQPGLDFSCLDANDVARAEPSGLSAKDDMRRIIIAHAGVEASAAEDDAER